MHNGQKTDERGVHSLIELGVERRSDEPGLGTAPGHLVHRLVAAFVLACCPRRHEEVVAESAMPENAVRILYRTQPVDERVDSRVNRFSSHQRR